MTGKKLPLLVLVAALAALAGTVALAVAKGTESSSPSTAAFYGPGMMGYLSGSNQAPVRDLADAKRRAQSFAASLKLKAGEVLRFERNYYVKLVDSKGQGATEVLVDPRTGAVSIEYGPAMMWNTRYGMMSGTGAGGMMGGGMMGGQGYGGMMGGSGSGGMMGGSDYGGMMGPGYRATGETTVTPIRAERIADRWLGANAKGLRAADAEAFPGYYTLETLRSGKIAGMISVNASTGAVWSHWWHGSFVSMVE